MPNSQKLLAQEATRLLRASGYTWAGRAKKTISSAQYAFERRLIRVPVGLPQPPRKHMGW